MDDEGRKKEGGFFDRGHADFGVMLRFVLDSQDWISDTGYFLVPGLNCMDRRIEGNDGNEG